MKSYRLLALLLIVGVLLAACSDSAAKPAPLSEPLPAVGLVAAPAVQKSAIGTVEDIQGEEIPVAQIEEPSGDEAQSLWPDGEVQFDDQGAVEVAITPLNLNAPDGSLNFDVGLNTHSVDLSMDLAPLTTLEADNGLGVQAVLWEAPRGGHHVSGVLSFPITVDGTSLLEGASYLTLRIRDVDAPERVFTWNLTG